MNDCPNATMREQLPDLLHDRLDAGTRAAVMAHVAVCADCRAELELLRDVREMLVRRTPRVDINYVIQALPKPPQRSHHTRLETARRRVWSDWRIAAAVTLLVVGGSSVAVMHRNAAAPFMSDSRTAVTRPAQPVGAPSRTVAPSVQSTPATLNASNTSAPAAQVATKSGSTSTAAVSVASSDDAAPGGGYGATGRLGDLNERQLKTLLDQIGQLQPVPVTDPEPVTIRVNPNADSPQGGT